jgi:hypothetical protein
VAYTFGTSTLLTIVCGGFLRTFTVYWCPSSRFWAGLPPNPAPTRTDHSKLNWHRPLPPPTQAQTGDRTASRAWQRLGRTLAGGCCSNSFFSPSLPPQPVRCPPMPPRSAQGARRRQVLRESQLQQQQKNGGVMTPKVINAAPELEKAELYGIHDQRPAYAKLMGLAGRIFIETIPQWLAVGAMLAFIFGGCCSNVSSCWLHGSLRRSGVRWPLTVDWTHLDRPLTLTKLLCSGLRT